MGREVCIHGWIENQGLRFPQGDPPGMYPAVHQALGLASLQSADTNNGPCVVALFVHELYWVLARSHYAAILALLLDNCREQPTYVPALRPLPPPPSDFLRDVQAGPQCLAAWAWGVCVPVYFKSAVIRLVEDKPPPAPPDPPAAASQDGQQSDGALPTTTPQEEAVAAELLAGAWRSAG